MLLLRKIHEVEQYLMKFAMDGFREKGFTDDFHLCVRLLELGNFIDEKVRTKKDGTGC
jgi:hypothetical protein